MGKNDLITAHQDSIYHAERLAKQSKCGCFYCLEIFTPNDIIQWTDQGRTALCPHCGIDSVIAETSDREITVLFLKEMQAYWF